MAGWDLNQLIAAKTCLPTGSRRLPGQIAAAGWDLNQLIVLNSCLPKGSRAKSLLRAGT
jgi:hypothetical protein